MGQPLGGNDDAGNGGARTFTQSEVDAIVRDRLARDRSKIEGRYADYDDLKAKAAEADKSKSQLEKLSDQVKTLTESLTESKRETMVAEVAKELGISVKQAKRLSGNTRDELLADGRDFLEDFDPKSGKNGKTGNTDDDGDGDDSGNQGGSASSGSTETPAGKQQTGGGNSGGRPRENLRSGAPLTDSKPEETDPLKLAALVPRL